MQTNSVTIQVAPSPSSPPPPKSYNYVHIASVVTAYFIISISMVFINKVLLSKSSSGQAASIPAPLFITWFQSVITSLIILTGGLCRHLHPFLAQFPPPEYEYSTVKTMYKLPIIYVGMVTFNNLCLQYVEVSFYNVARSLTVCFNVVFSYILLGQKTSCNVIGTLFVVVIGYVLGNEGEVHFSTIGAIFGVCSSAFVALNSTFTSSVLNEPCIKRDKWRLAMYTNITASIIFLPLVVLFNEPKILSDHWVTLMSPYFWFVMLMSGVLGFLVNIISVMQIQCTSPLTHNISGTAKACVQTVLALIIWRNPYTREMLLGVALVIFGSMGYTWVRAKEEEAERHNKPAAAEHEVVTVNVANETEMVDLGQAQQQPLLVQQQNNSRN
eukprot:TRINITY_DN2225_c0_g1_i1.p1 TRINITY_DN2225_c0_g1~~TRINITY_DN2225_c0_g1_i1.p1  ORF type:complete len:384 (+),score=51.78 TRINITY_DN2225_c0_g1_i1:127-1278(+)